MVGVVVAPLLVIELVLASPDLLFLVFMVGLAGYIWAVQLNLARTKHLFRVSEPVRARARRLLHREP